MTLWVFDWMQLTFVSGTVTEITMQPRRLKHEKEGFSPWKNYTPQSTALSVQLTHILRRPALFIAHLRSIFSSCTRPSDWEGWGSFMWLHQVISIITTSIAAAHQPLLTHHSLHLLIYSYLNVTYLYCSSLCLYHSCLCPSRALSFFLPSSTLTSYSPS